MAEASGIAVAVLAAGQSRRFRGGDKLAAPLRGLPLGLHVCRALAPLAFDNRWVIAARPDHACAKGWEDHGFQIAVNRDALSGMGSSVALAAKLALAANADALMIVLADMPLVPVRHYQNLIQAAQPAGPAAMVATAKAGTAMPPVVFGQNHFGTLRGASGDVGARPLLRQALLVACLPALLLDIDDVTDLSAAEPGLSGG